MKSKTKIFIALMLLILIPTSTVLAHHRAGHNGGGPNTDSLEDRYMDKKNQAGERIDATAYDEFLNNEIKRLDKKSLKPLAKQINAEVDNAYVTANSDRLNQIHQCVFP